MNWGAINNEALRSTVETLVQEHRWECIAIIIGLMILTWYFGMVFLED